MGRLLRTRSLANFSSRKPFRYNQSAGAGSETVLFLALKMLGVILIENKIRLKSSTTQGNLFILCLTTPSCCNECAGDDGKVLLHASSMRPDNRHWTLNSEFKS